MKNDMKWIREQLEAHEERLRYFQLATFDALDALISVRKKLDELEKLKAGTDKKKEHQINGHRFAPPMTPEEFSKWLDEPERARCDYIVLIRKGFKEREYEEINELILWDWPEDRFVWKSNWWEGEPFVEMMGAVPVDEVVI